MISENIYGKFSLYVGDLDSSVEDSDLYNKFSEIGEVSSVKICRDLRSGSSLGYAYVNFNHKSHAEKELNFKELKGKQMRIMFSKRDPSMRNSGKGNVFVKNLDKSFDNKQLYHLFSSFGLILSCKVARDAYGVSMGYGFVQFYSETSVLDAIIVLDGAFVCNQYLQVCHFVNRRQWDESPVFTNVYVKNLVETATDDDLKKIFEVFGEITSAVVESAATAVEKMNGIIVEEKELYVGRAHKKKNRLEDLRNQIKLEKKNSRIEGLNLYVKNLLDDSVTEEMLRELFSEFGTITSCKVLGLLSSLLVRKPAEALNEMNGKTVGKKPIYVSLAQRKEEQSNVNSQNVVSSTRQQSPYQHPIFSQAGGPATMLPPRPPFRGYNFQPLQPHLMFGSRPVMPVPNFMVPPPLPFQRPALYPPAPPFSFHHGVQPMKSLPLPQPQLWNPYGRMQ
ncbi:unnamed protein product [Arabis nemorensis]|uniref:RRM domain-containing protein n=1 Tax=Arabis nemorensis TaxID=586526 RepID=A0A565CDE9_9BRAS|nr:unnamed protein product [Arabis nemorensis]